MIVFLVLERCNSIWLQNELAEWDLPALVLERCNSIWLQNGFMRSSGVSEVLERCNSIWLQNGEKTKPFLQNCGAVLALAVCFFAFAETGFGECIKRKG